MAQHDDDEKTIYAEFATGDLTYLDAILRLQALTYPAMEAEQIVDEWAEDLQADREPDGDDYADRAEWKAHL